MAIIAPTITAPTIPTPPPPPPEVAPVVWVQYGTLVQDYLDGRIQDFSTYYTPIATMYTELNLLRDSVFRKYHRSRKEMLQIEGKKNLSTMPGYLQRKLMDLSLDEKRELSEAGIKVASQRVTESLEAVYEGTDLAIKSDVLRSDMHEKNQSMTFEVAKAAIMAAYENAKQRVTAFESWLKAISTEFELVIIEYKALADSIESQISAVKIEILAAENIGTAEELQMVQAQLEVAQTQILEAQSRLPLAQAEIRKAQAEMDVLEVERLLATFKELSANASMDKSEARRGDIEISRQKIAIELAKVGLNITKDSADTAGELSSINTRIVEEQIDTAKSRLQVVSTEADAELTGIKTNITASDTSAEYQKSQYFASRSASVLAMINARVLGRRNTLSNRVFVERGLIQETADNTTENINAIAHNTIQELAADLNTSKTDFENRSNLETQNMSELTAAHVNALNQDLVTHTTALQQLKDANQSDLTARLDAAQTIANSTVNTLASQVDGQKDMLVSNQAGLSVTLSIKKDELMANFDEWKTAHEVEVAAEAEAIAEAAENAANADVTTKYYYRKG